MQQRGTFRLHNLHRHHARPRARPTVGLLVLLASSAIASPVPTPEPGTVANGSAEIPRPSADLPQPSESTVDTPPEPAVDQSFLTSIDLRPGGTAVGDEKPINEPASSQPVHAKSLTSPDGELLATEAIGESTPATRATPSDARPLGESRGLFELGLGTPPESETAADVAPMAWMDRLDPRRNELTRVFAALTIVIGLLVVIRLLVSRSGRLMGGSARPSGVLEVLARYPIARGQSLVLLQLGRRVVLVHQTRASMTTLAELSDPHEVATLLARLEAGSTKSNAGRFRAILREHEIRYGEPAALTGDADIAQPAAGGENAVIDLTRRPRRSPRRRRTAV